MFDFDVRDRQETGTAGPRQTPGTPCLEPEATVLPFDPCHRFDGAGTLDRTQLIQDLPRLRPPLVLLPTCTLAEALGPLCEHGQSMALVASHGYLLGTLTDKQVLLHLRARSAEVIRDTAVWRLMSPVSETLRQWDSVGYALYKMRVLDAPALPVLDEAGSIAGVLECRDLLGFSGPESGAPTSDFVRQG